MTSKKQRVDSDSSPADNVQWKITFDQTQGIRTLIEVVGNILTRVNLRISFDKTRDTYFLCIDSIDPQRVCMIQARLICENTVAVVGKDEDFCIDSNIFNLILKNIPSHYSLDLIKKTDSADIYINAYETLSNSHHTQFKLPTLLDESDSMQLTDMEYKYTIEIDLCTLRQIVKMSTHLRAPQVDFSVSEPNNKKKGVLRTTFTISSQGDAAQAHNFHSATVTDEGESNKACVIRAATDSTAPDINMTDMIEQYSDSFSTSYLNYFLKSMERQIITMKLSKVIRCLPPPASHSRPASQSRHASPHIVSHRLLLQDKPLILHYPLGADMSYICFVLAPKTSTGE